MMGIFDLFFANGHLNSVSGDNRQSNLLFENDGKVFLQMYPQIQGSFQQEKEFTVVPYLQTMIMMAK